MKELFERIIVWHEKNLPSGLPYEPLPQIGFLLEELNEVNKEFIKGDIDAAVGEITDLIVFSMNAIKLLTPVYCFNKHFAMKSVFFNNQYEFFIIFHRDILAEMYLVFSRSSFFTLFVDYESIIELCVSFIGFLGYSPELALEETVKKIESRRGAWDASIGKWVKEKNQSDVYIPDFFLARLS